MLKFLIFFCATWALVAPQGFDYYDYVDAVPVQAQAPQPVARRPPPPSRAPTTRSRPQADRPRPPPVPQNEGPLDPNTTPVPITKDSRRVDSETGAFIYEYAGADGSSKQEIRYPNGTVVGSYSFINDLGEEETRHYTAGQVTVDETTDPNYVDLGNYELYKHLEQPYVHIDGGFGQEDAPRVRSEPSRPRAQGRPRPAAPRQAAPRPAAPRPAAPRPAPPPPPPPPQAAPVPLDFNDDHALFSQPPLPVAGPGAHALFSQPPLPVAGPGAHALFSQPPLPVAGPVAPVAQAPVAPAPLPPSRPRQGGRRRRPQAARQPQHFDFNGQAPDSVLDSLIQRFQ